MSCKDSSRWEWAVEGAEKPIVFKLLINDQLWSEGENYEILPGEEKVLRPMF